MVQPNFLLIGAMRSGTTSLFAHLAAHPDVFPASEKELRFFDLYHERGMAWYESRFAGGEGKAAIGEASQTYMYDPDALRRMAAALPKARLIAILRDPVDRAYSHYWLNRARGREDLGFPEAVEAEKARLRHASGSDAYFYSYIDRGRYRAQLERVCSYYDRTSLHVLLFDDLRDAPSDAYAQVCRFLGIDDAFIPPSLDRPINAFQEFRSLRARTVTKTLRRRGLPEAARWLGAANRRRRAYPPMAPELRTRLGQVLREGNEALAEWLGRDLGSWTGVRGSSPQGTTVPRDSHG